MASGRPIVVQFAADVRDWLKGTGKAERSLDDIADSIEDATKDGDKFERQMTDSMKKVEKGSDKAARSIETDFDDAARKAGDAGQALGDEFVGNVGESIGSGNIDGLLQDTVGGLVGSIGGPLAIVAGGIGATVVGLYQKNKEEVEALAEAVKERVDTMFQAFVEGAVTATGVWEETALKEKVTELLDSMSPEEIEEARAAAETLGVPWEVMAEALAGDTDAIRILEDATWDAHVAAQAQRDEFALLPNEISEGATAIDKEIGGAIDYVTRLTSGELNPAISDFTTKAEALADYLDGIDGKTVKVHYQLVPADAYTAANTPQEGP